MPREARESIALRSARIVALDGRVNRRVRAAAAGILLDCDPGLDDVPRFSPRRQNFLHVVIARAVEYFEITLFVLERHGARGKTVACEQRRE